MPDNDSQTALRGRPKDPAKREAILDAAKALFIAQGFAGTSMDAVATEAGVSKLTVYSHFSDKATLFAAAVEAKCEGMMPFPIFSLEAGDDLTVVLERIGHAFVTLINSEEAIALERLMASLAGQDTEMARLFFMQPVIGCGEAPTEQDAKAHVREVVRVFLKGYGVAPS